ncbi:MAG: NUDIX domain-containing protein [Gaiellaceae bacterium]|jgi:ADP-ribose pyrophosphatase YjhB (NUDIX family)
MSELHGWRFCPRCGAELAIERTQATCPACGSQYYANSAPAVGAICEDELGRLMLVRRALEPRKDKWDTPGGFLEEGELPLEGLKRELLEETGVVIEPGEFFAAFTDLYGDAAEAQTILSLNWKARIVSGEPKAADDISEIRWFGPDELPAPTEIAFPSVAEAVELWRAQHS